MPKKIDVTGQRFGRLVVLAETDERTKSRQIYWVCRCDCGVEKKITTQQLVNKGTQSCGCLAREINSKRSVGNTYGLKHGLSHHPLRYIRKSMIHRCYNKNNRFYKNYGGRGIDVCKEWLDSLPAFYEWAMGHGWKKGLSIDRLDNDKGYSPTNCHWVTVSKNSKKNCVLGKDVGKGRKKKDPDTIQV